MKNKVNREKLLADLLSVKPGLSSRELLEQSSCFCFRDGHVLTFNDEVCCRKKVDLDISGAVQAAPLLEVLQKIEDSELLVEENERGELQFRGKRKAFALVREKEVQLPVDQVEVPEEWTELPGEFFPSVEMALRCVSSEETRFVLTCVHLTPDFVESCDNLQLVRCRVKTGISEDVLVRGSSLREVILLAMNMISLTRSWVHFSNPDGLVVSCRRYQERFPSLDSLIEFDGTEVAIPRSVEQAAARASIFTVDSVGHPLVEVRLEPGWISIRGEGVAGWYRERSEIDYKGPSMRFFIAPSLLGHIASNYDRARISDNRLKVSGWNWDYVTVLGTEAGEAESSEQEE